MSVFEKQYLDYGLSAQRKYPNEALLAFIGSNYFSLDKEKRKDLKILELGCGSGANLWMFAKEGFDAYGIDFSPTGIELCKKTLESWNVNATLEVADMCKLPFKDGFFDVIVDVVSCQHLNYQEHVKCFKEVVRCLKPEGRFFSYHLGVNSTSFQPSFNQLDKYTIENIPEGYPLANNGKTCFLDRISMSEMLNTLGFQNHSIESVTRTYDQGRHKIEYFSVVAQL